MGISINPSDAVSGGLTQDVDVLVERCRAAIYDYNGKSERGSSLAVHMTLVTQDSDPVTLEQYYSVGNLNRFAPAETVDGEPLTNLGDEGKFIVAAVDSTATALNKNSNFMFFMDELVKSKFPQDRISEDLSSLEGMIFHAILKPQPTRAGMTQQTNANGKERTVLVPSSVSRFPWDSATKGKTKAATAAAGSKSSGTDVNAIAVTAIQTILSDPKNGSGVVPAEAKKLAFKALLPNTSIKSEQRNEACAKIVDSAWLEVNQGPDSGFMFDGTTISAL